MAKQVARMGLMRNVYKMLEEKHEVKDRIEDLTTMEG
jgi:hypothetical protein